MTTPKDQANDQTNDETDDRTDDRTGDICEVVITAADREWLAAFTRRLIEDRLAACGHQIPAIRSIYRWDGAIHDDPEARVALHTRTSLVPRIVARTNAEHLYDVPCVIALPVVGGNPAYAEWVWTESSGDGLEVRTGQ
jgi:periplasmic divalent cation tolerance protein